MLGDELVVPVTVNPNVALPPVVFLTIVSVPVVTTHDAVMFQLPPLLPELVLWKAVIAAVPAWSWTSMSEKSNTPNPDHERWVPGTDERNRMLSASPHAEVTPLIWMVPAFD